MHISPLDSLPTTTGIVCNDAGAANILFSWIRYSSKPTLIFASGPALNILKRDHELLNKVQIVDSVDELISQCSKLITGTGWQTDQEISAVQSARLQDKYVISVIDHWTNYKDRFLLKGKLVLPDEIWVTDIWALKIARKEFSEIQIKLQLNTYATDLIRQIKSVEPIPRKLLYIAEPIRSPQNRPEKSELEAFKYFLNNAPNEKIDLANYEIHVRPHPSQNKFFFDDWKEFFPGLVIDSGIQPLAQALGEASIIVGMYSYALSISAQAGKKTISAVPEWREFFTLPNTDIIAL